MYFFISGAEIVFVFFIVLLVFGADKIPSIARTLAKGVNEIKTEIKKSVDIDSPSVEVGKELKNQVQNIKEDFDDLTDSIKRDL